jgi:hypothetical protein
MLRWRILAACHQDLRPVRVLRRNFILRKFDAILEAAGIARRCSIVPPLTSCVGSAVHGGEP